MESRDEICFHLVAWIINRYCNSQRVFKYLSSIDEILYWIRNSRIWIKLFEFCYLEEETEADPLIVPHISSFFWIYCLVNTRMSNINTYVENNIWSFLVVAKITYSFPECTWNSVGGVNPTICVENIFWNVFGVNTI